MAVLTAGGIGGMMYWITCYPLDVIKSKMQTDAANPAERKYRSVVDCVSQTIRAEGLRGFARGFAPCLVRSFPANATCFFGYELTKSMLN